jgi:catechol 2,3-dioxygenase-like lactoylglutathione lyase family enzyme
METRREEIPEPVFTDTLQVALVVRDLDAALHTFVYEYGVRPWRIMEMGPGAIDDLVHNDEPAEFSMRIALAKIGNVEWELIQPTDDKGPYAEFLATKGEGLHHIGMAVRDYDEALARLREKGHNALIGGVYQGIRLSYMSTDRDLGAITEIFDFPDGQQPSPDSVYPPEDG